MSPIVSGAVAGLVLLGIEWLCVMDTPKPFTPFSWVVLLIFPVIAGLVAWSHESKKNKS
jgi:hypothetical protein